MIWVTKKEGKVRKAVNNTIYPTMPFDYQFKKEQKGQLVAQLPLQYLANT